MKTALRPDELARIPLLAALSRRERERLATVLRDRSVAAGEVAAAEGEEGIGFFMIVAGSATVEQDGAPVRTLGPGDWFGEIAVMSGGRRSASVVATSPLTLVTIFNREIWRLEREAPEVAAVLRETIATRLGGQASAT